MFSDKKLAKPVLYAGAAVVVLIAVIIAIFGQGGKQEPAAEISLAELKEFVPIEGARANSYQTMSAVTDMMEGDLLVDAEGTDLKIFVYEDYASSLSAELAGILNQIVRESAGKITLVSRPFILAGSTISKEAALAVNCAQDLGKGAEMRVLLLSAAANGEITEGTVYAKAGELQLNQEDFAVCLTNEEKSVKLEGLMSAAKANLIIGAPTLLVGDEMIIGARPYSDFVDSNGDAIEGLKAVIERKLKK